MALPTPLSAEAVRAGEVVAEQTDEEGGREADDVEVVPLDARDERRAEALDRVSAGAACPLARRHVRRDVPRRKGPEPDRRDVVLDDLPSRRSETKPRDDLVRLAAEQIEHGRR